MLGSVKQLETYRKAVDTLQRQNHELQQDKQKVVTQLQSLFSLYNKQKKSIEQLSEGKKDTESERKEYKSRIEVLEQANSKLRNEMSREIDLRNSRHNVRLVALKA